MNAKRAGQKGIALYFALIFILILSVLGVSIMFISQLETWSSLNYREMTQARYGAEAGLNSAANYIVNTYCAPGNSTCSNGSTPASGDTASLYNTNVSPVTLVSNGSVVTLSTTSSAATYPVASVETAFQSAASGSLAAGTTSVNYTATATLVAMNQVTTASGPATVQTWSITADGAIAGVRSAKEEVTGVVEQQVTFGSSPLPAYGVFATGTGCSAVTMSGAATVNSYNSAAALKSGSVVLNNYDGDVGTNGNISLQGSATIDGTFSSPRTGVNDSKKLASCTAGTSSETAIDQTLATSVTECGTAAPVSPATTCSANPVQLPQNLSLSLPSPPAAPSSWNTAATVTINTSTTCTSLGLASPGCTGSAGHLTFTPAAYANGSFPPIDVAAGAVTLTGSGTFNLNGLSVNSGGSLSISPTGSTTINTTDMILSGGNTLTVGNSSPIVFNVYGDSSSDGVSMTNGTLFTLTGSSLVTMNIASTVSNPLTMSGDATIVNSNSAGAPTPAIFQVLYGGTGTISVYGGATCAGVVYAPSAPISATGGAAWYGALIGSTVTDTNGVNIYYDTQLANVHLGGIVATTQQFMMDSFSWSRF